MMECEYRLGATQQEALAEVFDLAAAADAGGLDAVWLAERHFASRERLQQSASGGVPSYASAPLILATAIAARTSRLRIGIAVSVLPLSHPVRLAEEVATLDQISGGRLDFGVGRSGFATAYAGYGVSYGESRERFEECLDILKLAWTQESFSYSGAHYNFEDVSVVPKPLQKPHPPIRVAATTTDTFPSVGRDGQSIFIGLRGTDIAQNATNLAAYRRAWHDAGHPGEGDVYLRIPVYVGATAEQAYEEPRESTLLSYRRLAANFARSVGVAGMVASEERAQRAEVLATTSYDDVLRQRVAYGTAEAVVERLSAIRDELGLSGFIIEPNVGGSIPRELVFASVNRFATQVAPRLR
jgi:alkanesulfonate monooxygenase SsuD/methylene tetrahydromethanopterin reductase-like flavin-dependent oxidoreductase (luciferase family)